MNFSSLLIGLVVSASVLANPPAAHSEKVSIPLDEIWGYNVPGTRDIEALAERSDGELLKSIFQSFKAREDGPESDQPRPSFAVSGSGPVALRASHSVLGTGAQPRSTFSPDEEITIVLFSDGAWDNHVHIEEVARQGDRVIIRYWLEQHVENRDGSKNLVLIPLGKLPLGKYRVEFKQLPRKQKSIQIPIENYRQSGVTKFVEWEVPALNEEWSRRFLSRPFRFCVTEKIPLDQIWAYDMPGTRNIQDVSKEAESKLLTPIFESLWVRANQLRFKDLARPGFAVSGMGLVSLSGAYTVLAQGEEPQDEFSRDAEISLVFFSEPISRYQLQIQQVEREHNLIVLHYQLKADLVDYTSRSSFINFALIPLGKLPVGKYQVEMCQVPRDLTPVEVENGLKPIDKEWSKQFVCKPFSFTVSE